MTYTVENPAPQHEAYCALCNEMCLYVVTMTGPGPNRRAGTRCDIFDRDPAPGGRWARLPSGIYRLGRPATGYKPHRCSRQRPVRFTPQAAERWLSESQERMGKLRNKWCVDKSGWAVKQTQVLFGADDTTRGFTGPLGIETQLGKTMGVRNRHYSWQSSSSRIGQNWRDDHAVGAVPMVSLGGQGYDQSVVHEIVAGAHDSYWEQLFQEIATPRGLFRPWMEMNGAHNGYSGDPTLFIRMWQRLHGLAAQHAPNLCWIFCPQEYDPHVLWPSYYPGDQYVDWMGLDLYRTTFTAALPWRQFANQHHLPFSICESGFEQGKVVADPTSGITLDKDGSVTGRSLIDKTRTDVVAHPNTVMYLVWNNIGPVGDDFIDTSPKSVSEYKRFTADKNYKFA